MVLFFLILLIIVSIVGWWWVVGGGGGARKYSISSLVMPLSKSGIMTYPDTCCIKWRE